jgi:general secretion pathway protein C
MELASRLRVRIAKKLLALAFPGAIALAAFFQARAIGALVDASMPAAAVAPYAETRAPAVAPPVRPSADALATHNPFEHAAASATAHPSDAPTCAGVRVVFAVSAEHDDLSFAAVELGGKSYLRARGGTLGDLRVAAVAPDRVLFEQEGGRTCEARVFAGPIPAAAPSPTLGGLPGIARVSATSFEIDRGVLDKILENQTDLGRTPLVPEKGGARLVRVKEGSLLAQLGFESGDRLVAINGMELSSPEKILELYARVRGGSLGRITVRLERAGKPMEIDFKVV